MKPARFRVVRWKACAITVKRVHNCNNFAPYAKGRLTSPLCELFAIISAPVIAVIIFPIVIFQRLLGLRDVCPIMAIRARRIFRMAAIR
jgi:hypothetical protein